MYTKMTQSETSEREALEIQQYVSHQAFTSLHDSSVANYSFIAIARERRGIKDGLSEIKGSPSNKKIVKAVYFYKDYNHCECNGTIWVNYLIIIKFFM